MKELPYKVITLIRNIEPAKAWCEKQFGKRWEAIGYREGTWTVFWRGRGLPIKYEWNFKNEKDALLFSLRWL